MSEYLTSQLDTPVKIAAYISALHERRELSSVSYWWHHWIPSNGCLCEGRLSAYTRTCSVCHRCLSWRSCGVSAESWVSQYPLQNLIDWANLANYRINSPLKVAGLSGNGLCPSVDATVEGNMTFNADCCGTMVFRGPNLANWRKSRLMVNDVCLSATLLSHKAIRRLVKLWVWSMSWLTSLAVSLGVVYRS